MTDGYTENANNPGYANSQNIKQLRLQYATQLTAKIYRTQATLLLFGIGFIIAFFMNNFRYHQVNGTWLQTHFRWQVQTFIFGMIWAIVGGIIVYQSQRFHPDAVIIGLALIALDILWIYYRIIKGKRRLKKGLLMYHNYDMRDVSD